MNFRIRDKGTDGGVDSIVNAGAMYQSANLGYQGWADAHRVGDNLVIHLPHRPYYFRHPARPAYDIVVVDHYDGGAISSFEVGGVIYQLATGDIGTLTADIMAGDRSNNSFSALDGDDFVYGYHGHDTLDLGAGDDHGFGGRGRDSILGGLGNDVLYAGTGHDTIDGGDGFDWIYGEEGKDVVRGGDGNDWLLGGAGNDTIRGGTGDDHIEGGGDNDLMSGQKGADKYTISTLSDGSGAGHDTIAENGTAGSWGAHDVIEIRGIYGPHVPSGNYTADAFAKLSFSKVGDDMVMTIGGAGGSSLTVEHMFDAARHNRYFIEEMVIDGGYWSGIHFQFLDGQVAEIGDDRSYALGYGADLNEVIFGTDGDDQIFGGTGTNFIWTGDGADTLIYKVGDGESLGIYGGRISSDIVEDFDVTMDILDFSEVTGEGITPYLQYSEDAEGDLIIFIDTGNWEVADIRIELRGVTIDQVDDLNLIF